MENKEILLKDGLVEIPCEDFSDVNLLDVASTFGTVILGARNELVQTLPARGKGSGPKGCFSYTMGYGKFPWHTDTAYWDKPARFLLLASEKKSPCATLYQNFDVLRRAIPEFEYLMSRAVYLLEIPGKKRYLSPNFLFGNECGYRLDFHIYQPVNSEAEILMTYVARYLESNFDRLVWTGCNVVILDNWRIIHAREDASNDSNRILKRIYINDMV